MDLAKAPQHTVVSDKLRPNGIGGVIATAETVMTIRGFIDLLSGDEKTDNQARLEDSTHILITNFVTGIKRGHRIVDSSGVTYEVKLVDDPVGLGHHLEVYLRFVGVR